MRANLVQNFYLEDHTSRLLLYCVLAVNTLIYSIVNVTLKHEFSCCYTAICRLCRYPDTRTNYLMLKTDNSNCLQRRRNYSTIYSLTTIPFRRLRLENVPMFKSNVAEYMTAFKRIPYAILILTCYRTIILRLIKRLFIVRAFSDWCKAKNTCLTCVKSC